MLAIADSGSTKADWKIINDKGEILDLSTMGFNPNYHSKEIIIDALEAQLAPKVNTEMIRKVLFYGAGCWDSGRKEKIASAMRQVFINAEIEVDHDLLAAARATCGDKPGISCILGTGSNSILFDGEKEVDNVTNLGFLLGDEGSGSHLGKKIIRAYFYREMPEDLKEQFKEWVPGGKSEILDNIYGEGSPAVYLASFARFLSNNKNHPFITEIVYECFEEFVRRHICKYENHQNLPIHFIGSVAYYFKHVLDRVLKDKGLELGVVIKKPIHNLAKFHIEQGGFKKALVNF
jgi:N-acetylglucosamine kinase-like BadF-type ATPase